MVNPLVNIKLTKVLMVSGSGLNILYVETLDAMHIPHSKLNPSDAPFHKIVPVKKAQPLRQMALDVTFGTPKNFRTETLTFEVMDFKGAYHAILGHPCYAKFMARPCYVYQKLKMPSPNGIITVHGNFKHAHACDIENVDLAEGHLAAAEFDVIKYNVREE